MTTKRIITKKVVTLTLSPESNDDLYVIGEKLPFNKDGHEVVAEYWELRNLQAINYVSSLEQIPYPTFSLDASDSERSLVLLNLQWTSPRYDLKIWLEEDNLSTSQLDLFSLLSPSPYPYSKISIGDYSLGSNSTLKASIYDAGYGLLTGNDKVIIVGELIHRVKIIEHNTSIALSALSTAINGISQALTAQAMAMENQAIAIGRININVSPEPNPDPNTELTIEEIIMTTDFSSLSTITNVNDNDKILILQDGVLKLIAKQDLIVAIEEPQPEPIGDEQMLTVISIDYTVTQSRERLAVNPVNGNVWITLKANPVIGDELELYCLKNPNDNKVFIDFNGSFYDSNQSTMLNQMYNGGRLIYGDGEWGFYAWQATQNN